MRAAIYCRVSTREQAESGYSIPDQVRNCSKKAKELGATVVEEFLDKESGAFLERPGLQKLRHSLQQNYFDLVITKSPDRLSRNITHQLILREEIIKSGAELKFLTFEWQNTPDGRMLMNVQGVISDYEREVIRERTMMGRRSKVLAGKIPLNSHVYGYFFDNEQSKYYINEQEAQVVRDIYKWLLKGDELSGPMGGVSIAKKLAKQGIKPPRRAKNSWAKATIYKILKNPIYTGTAYFYKEKKRKTGLHTIEITKRPESDWLAVQVPPIIDPKTFAAAQRKLSENARSSRRNTKHKYLLQGIIFCGVCGRRMAINPERMRNSKKVPAYYVCPKDRPNERRYSTDHSNHQSYRCPARTIPINIVEDEVWTFIGQLISSDEKTIRNETDNIYQDGKAESINGKLIVKDLNCKEDALIKRRKKIAKWFREELMTEIEAEKELKEIKMELMEIKERRQKLQAELLIINSEEDAVTAIVKQIKSVGNPTTLSFEEKRTLLENVLNGIHVTRVDDARGYGAANKIKMDIRLDLRP
ncbi:MAG: hypothetical protein FH756_19960 [Firmicutes bacterium]|nr:hypothetical protein [Bacillota bacterium]